MNCYVGFYSRQKFPAGRGNSYLARIYLKSANPPGQIGLRQKFLPQVLLGIGETFVICSLEFCVGHRKKAPLVSATFVHRGPRILERCLSSVRQHVCRKLPTAPSGPDAESAPGAGRARVDREEPRCFVLFSCDSFFSVIIRGGYKPVYLFFI